MKNVLTIYTDGSYREHGGWAYVIYDDYKKRYPCVVYGTCNAETGTHAEAIACVKALDNFDLFLKYDSIEVRTDQLYIVQMSKKIIQNYKSGKELPLIESNDCPEELYCIAYIQYQMGLKLKFKKSPENHFLRLAHKYAKMALNLKLDNEACFYKADPQVKSIENRHNSTNYNELRERYKCISKDAISTSVDGIDETNNYINLRVCDIDMLSKTHLEARHLKLSGELARVRNGEIPVKPIIVHTLENGRYELISGFKSYCIAKIVNVEYVPSIIINTYPLGDNNNA